jgi:cytochrome c oxidase assembly protein subunit 15
MGIHGAIEFGNRMLTFVLGAIAVLGVLAALRSRPRRRRVVLLSLLVLATIPAQALVGMVTVWTELNPWVVGSHFLFSMAVIAAAYAFWRATREPDGEVTPLVPRPIRQLGVLLLLSALATLALGTLVTGAGPHAGDENAKRNGLDLANITQLHADSVFLLVGLSIATWFALRAVAAPRPAMRAASALLLIELSQSAVGFIQYATNLPELAVGLHMAGACAVWLAVLAFWYATRTRASGQPAAGGAEAAAPVEALARA